MAGDSIGSNAPTFEPRSNSNSKKPVVIFVEGRFKRIERRDARATSRKFFKIKLITFRSSGKRASEEGARKGFQPQVIKIITWKILPCKLRRRSRTIAKYAPTLTGSGNIAREEFFQCFILYFFQYSGNFPVILTESCNASSRSGSRIVFCEGETSGAPGDGAQEGSLQRISTQTY
jgi:hypothetical protein